jgi:hypothetical protein
MIQLVSSYVLRWFNVRFENTDFLISMVSHHDVICYASLPNMQLDGST